MSRIVSQIFQNIRHTLAVARHEKRVPAVFVGSDHIGNKYYERKGNAEKSIKGKRWVEGIDPDPAVVPDVTAEWEAWLRGRKTEPPTKEQIDSTRKIAEQQEKQKQSGKVDQKMGSFPSYSDYEVEPGQPHKEMK